jgi:hypothetical protein
MNRTLDITLLAQRAKAAFGAGFVSHQNPPFAILRKVKALFN